jgi:hypothetical protein
MSSRVYRPFFWLVHFDDYAGPITAHRRLIRGALTQSRYVDSHRHVLGYRWVLAVWDPPFSGR